MSQSIKVTSSAFTFMIFLSTLTPMVVWYVSSKMLSMNRRTRLVLPTEKEPSMQTFFWSMAISAQFSGAAPEDALPGAALK